MPGHLFSIFDALRNGMNRILQLFFVFNKFELVFMFFLPKLKLFGLQLSFCVIQC